MAGQQKALYISQKQGPLVVGDIDVPTPAPGEVLIKVEATGLNPADWKVWMYGVIKETFPAILGLEGAGTVEAVGESVTGFAKGDRVCVYSMIPRLRRVDSLFPACSWPTPSTTETSRSSSIRSSQRRVLRKYVIFDVVIHAVHNDMLPADPRHALF